MRIGFVGVGRIGLPVCANLVAAGYPVVAADARAEAEGAVLESGAAWAGSVRDVASRADTALARDLGLPWP